MANALSDALDHLRTTLGIEMGEAVTYRRGAQSVALTAVVGRTNFPIADDAAVGVAFQSIDFIVDPASLVLAAQRTLPRPGDEIDRTLAGGTVATHTVFADSGADCFSLDPLQTSLRVHTKLSRKS